MNQVLTALLLATLVGGADAAGAADDLDASFFGPITLGADVPKPEFIRKKPLIAKPGAAPAEGRPLILHVRPGQEERWSAHCAAYAACDRPVLFVRENWYRDVYLSAVGAQDGREQRYRQFTRLERPERGHHRQDDEE